MIIPESNNNLSKALANHDFAVVKRSDVILAYRCGSTMEEYVTNYQGGQGLSGVEESRPPLEECMTFVLSDAGCIVPI